MRYFIFLLAILLVSSIAFISWKRLPSIPVQTMKMQLPKGSKIFKEELLRGEIAETKIEHIAFAGPISKKIVLPKDSSSMFIFIKGTGRLKTNAKQYDIAPETLALPFSYSTITLDVAKGDTLHYVLFTKKLTEPDLADLKNFPEKNKYDIFFTKFSDCEPYTEKIKSPNTVSRTVLPADILPRVSLGTVETKGPDAVGAHAHPMLDQLFLSLAGNEIVVHADEQFTVLKEYSLLHIPLGSTHWAKVGEGKKMYYLWMDFFMTREGQEWLKTHKPISKKME